MDFLRQRGGARRSHDAGEVDNAAFRLRHHFLGNDENVAVLRRNIRAPKRGRQ